MSSKRERYINMLAAIAKSPDEVPLEKLVRAVLNEDNLEGCQPASENIPFHFWYLGEKYAIHVEEGRLRVEPYDKGGGLDVDILEAVLNKELDRARSAEMGADPAGEEGDYTGVFNAGTDQT